MSLRSSLAGALSSQRALSAILSGSARSTIVPAHLATASSTTDGTSFSATSITPTANALVLAWITAHTAGTPASPTITGNGLTWVEVGAVNVGSARRVSLFRAMGATPSAGQPVIDFGAVTQTAVVWSISQYTGVDTSGTNGSGAIQGSAVTNSGSAITTLQGLLPSFEHANNIHASGLAIAANAAITQDADFTQLGQDGEASTVIALASGWALGQLACDWTFASTTAGLVSVQVKAA